MKYRIKKVTKPCGLVYYKAQVNYGLWWWVWWDINNLGDADGISYSNTYLEAERRIALHILNTKKDKIEYFQIKIDEK